jgi:hypothetical protein
VGVAFGLVLIAAGAILTWAVNASLSGLDINAVGVILLILGIILVVLDMLWWQSWQAGPWRRTTYVDAAAPVAPVAPAAPANRRVVVEEDAVAPGPPGGPPPPP